MNTKKSNPAGLPSKKPGKVSGGGRDNNPPKSTKASPTPRKLMKKVDVQRIRNSDTPDRRFVDHAEKAIDRHGAKQPRH